LTKNSVKSAQVLANLLSHSKFTTIDIGRYKILKGVTVKTIGHGLTWTAIIITVDDIKQNGLDWKNGTEMVVGGATFISEVGWVIVTIIIFSYIFKQKIHFSTLFSGILIFIIKSI